jgi:hypothetical protein
MEFSNIDQIRTLFSINSTVPEEIRKELKRKLKDVHPDKNKPESDDSQAKQINSALDYIKSMNKKSTSTELAKRNELEQLSLMIKSLLPKVEEASGLKSLSSRIDKDIEVFKSRHKIPKITTSSISVVLSALWLFPESVQKHPVLSKLFSFDNHYFTAFWLTSIILTAFYWLITTLNENREKEYKQKLNLETVQNTLLRRFIDYKKYSSKGTESQMIHFDKEEFVSYLTGFESLDYPNVGYQSEKFLTSLKKIGELKKQIGKIDAELAQSLADVILQRAINKNFIIKDNSKKSLSDSYYFIANEKDLDQNIA